MVTTEASIETGELDLSHLHESVRPIAELPAAERLGYVRADRWIGHPAATEALQRLETLLAWPANQRMPNLLLVGPTNNGKSMIIEKFRRTHPVVSHEDREEIPVLVVQMPSEPSIGRSYAAVLAALGAPRRNYRVAEAEQVVVGLLRSTGVRMLIIDELHNVLGGRGDRRREFLNLLRLPRQRAADPAGRCRDPRCVSGDPDRRPAGEPVRAVDAVPVGGDRRCVLADGQLRCVVPAAPAVADRHCGDDVVPADALRRHDRGAGHAAHRGRDGRHQHGCGVDQFPHAAAGGVRRSDRTAPPVRA